MGWLQPIASAFAIFAATASFPSYLAAQDLKPSSVINLRCDGTKRVSRTGHEGWPEQIERVSIGIDINQLTGMAKITGLVSIIRVTDELYMSPYEFAVEENAFSWSKEVLQGSKRYLSTIQIDRLTASMEADDFVIDGEPGKGSIWSKSVRASCKRYVERAF